MVRTFSRVMVLVIALSLFQGVGSLAPTPALAADVWAPSGFVSGQWLVVAQQAVLSKEFPELKLESKAGKQWVVVIADVTNTGSDTAFDATTLLFGSLDKGVSSGIAPESFPTALNGFGAAKLDPSGSMMIADSATERVAIAYSVGEIAGGDTSLILGDQELPLGRAFVDKLNDADLRSPAPLIISQATVQEVLDGGEVKITHANGIAEDVKLSGVRTPVADGCFGPESAAAIMNLSGGAVWLQDDPSGTKASLVWYWDSSVGGLALLNQALLVQGFGGFDSNQGSALSPWLKQTSSAARQAEAGLWSTCKDADGKWINPPAVAEEPTTAPQVATDKRDQYEWIDARDLVIRPGIFEGQKIAVSGTVFNIQVEGELTFMQIWVDGGNYDAVMIGYRGDSRGIYEGTWVTIYGIGLGTMEGTNAYGAKIVQPLIRADIVDF